MQDHPSAAAILELATAQLGADAPADAGQARFERRVIAAALQLVRRALALSPASDAAEHGRLTALLDATGDLAALNRMLCARIRAGELSASTPGLSAHLRATALEKLAIDQPTYAAYRRALETSGSRA
ncbi:DUF6285 domain-containing protein [Terricaulis sp.]|uniref:DUF6285 domain-containing protein n=1 Tax=Terricaulis sp. TaxID=2768686 RepID=UPI003782EFC6